MTRLDDLLLELVDGLLPEVTRPDAGCAIRVDAVRLELPIEVRFDGSGVLATTPRGKLATGFAVPLGRLVTRIARGPA